MMPAAKHFDPVLGVDIHIIQPPGPVPPVPVPHPFTGMLIDPFDYVPILGATVMINGIPRAQAGTAGEAIPAHIPIGGVFVKPPANECEMFMGSMTVAVDGDAFSHLALPVLSCHDIGMITPPRPKKKSKKKIKSMVLPTSVVLSIPSGVFVGGPPTISLMALGMRAGMAALGRGFKKAKGKWKKRKGRKGKGKKKGKAKDNAPCGTAAHPVDVVTGACVDTLVDYESPHGPIFRWVRRYDSSEADVAGPMGRGFRHEYERFLEIDGDGYLYTDENGDQVEFPPFPQDENHVVADGFVLQRHDSAWFSIRPFRKPAMLFEFRDPKRPARLVRLDSGRHNLILLHNERDQIVEIRESGGHRYLLEYDNAGRVRRLARAQGDRIEDAATIFAYTYDGRGCLTGGTDAFGATFSHGYDAGFRLTAIIDRNSYKFTYEYDAEGRCVRTRGQDGLWAAEFKYDLLARATTVTFGDGGKWVHAYDANGMVTSITDPYGGIVTREVDDTGRVVSEKDPAGNVTEFLYSGTGAHTGRRDHLGYFALPYSEEPRPDDPLEVSPPDNAAEWEWGRLLSPEKCMDGPVPPGPLRARASDLARAADEQDPKSLPQAAEPKFDLLGRVESCGSGANAEYFRRDPEGHLVEHQTPEGTARFVPTSWRLLKAQTDALGNTTSFDHSMRGEVTEVRDPLGTITAYERDQKERITVVARGGVVRERYVWDAADNLIEKRDGEGRLLVRYEVDKRGLVTGRHFASGTVEQLKYDGRGRVTAAVSAHGKVKRSFDPRGRLIEDGRNGVRVSHRYEGRVLAETILFGRFKVVHEWRDTRTLLLRDPLGREHELMFDPRGTVLKRLSNGTKEVIRYGAGGRCRVKVIQSRGTSGMMRRRYQYSQRGQVLAVQDDRLGEMRFEYDAAGRLAAWIPGRGRREEFRCDAAGNLIEQPRLEGVNIGPANQLRAANGAAFAYNTRQHVERITTPEGPVRFIYDEGDQLVGRVSGKFEWTAEYDALGRRIAKRWAGRSVEFLWDDERLAAEIHDGRRCRIYIYPDAAALVPFMFVDYDSVDADPKMGRPGYIFCNQLGAPVEVQDENGAIVWSATVEPYGYAAVAEGSSVEMNLRWPGHYFDAETGLHYNRHRYYDPRLGCYLQSDPIGLAGGFNVYAYTRDPLSCVDVNGLACDGAASKPKGAAEKPPPRKTAKAGDDLGDLAKEAGMEKKHLENLQKRSQEKGEIIVVRASNPNSLPHHGKPGHVSKPVDCKFKTDKGDGLVKKPPDPMSPEDAAHMKKLEEKGWKTDADGNMIDPNGNKVYGDHDLQGVYEPTTHKDPFSGETHHGTHKVDTNDPDYRKGLNDDVCPENQMINHGANDNYMDPKDPSKMGRTPGADESYVVTKPDGSVTQVNGTDELKKFYGENNIPWPY